MARTTVEAVKAIIDMDLTDADIEQYIQSASTLVDSAVTSSAVSEDLKTELERWLTAHFIAATRVQQLSEAKAGSASAKFQGKTGMSLQSTHYGQNAVALDISGALAKLSGKTISFNVIPQF